MNQSVRIAAVILALGACSLLLQVTALREFMAAFSGNELDLGITLAGWLLCTGIGSITARGTEHPKALGMSVLATGPLAQALFFCIPFIRAFLDLDPGEVVPLGATVLSTFALLAPVCFLIGVQFPLAVRALAGKAPLAFLLEAAGAFLGGALFTFLLAGRVSAASVLTAVSAVYVLLGALLLRSKALALLIVLPLALSSGFERMRSGGPAEDLVPVSRSESRYGTIEVVRLRDQLNVYASGRFQFAYPDRQTDELRAHLPFSLHPSPKQVLLAGGAPGAALELLKYPDVSVDLVELDPELLRTARALLTPEDRDRLRDRRFTAHPDDARRFLRSARGPRYDLIILNGAEPSTGNQNRLYTVEFFREARRALNAGGMLVVNLPVSFGYVGKRMQTANGSLFASLAAVFPHVALSSEEYGVLAASDRPIETGPAVLRRRFAERAVGTDSFHPYILDDAFDPLRTAAHRSRLAAAPGVNTDARPVAYLLSLLVWAEMQRSDILLTLADHGTAAALLVAALAAATGAFFWRKRQAVAYSVCIAGFGSMALSVIVLLAYQSVCGYVYERAGLLTALFMAGSACGAFFVRRAACPLPVLMRCEAASIALLLLTPLFFRHEALFYVLAALGGGLGGAVFIAATRVFAADDRAAAAGRLYGIDLAGSFLGALLTAVILVPLLGIRAAVLLVVVLKGVSLVVLTSLRHEKA